MELSNKNIKIKTNGGELKSIKFQDIEILYQGDQGWKKTFPIIFPVVGISDAFEIDGKNYKIPKHGFWRDLKWNTFLENKNIVLSAIHVANNIYPFSMDIQQFISIGDNEVQMETKISNISKEPAYFHFGLHPAFNIDNNSKWKYNSNKLPYKILSTGRIDNEFKFNRTFVDTPFGIEFDTLIYKDVDINEGSFKYNGLNISIKHNANNLQIWKPEKDNFICIEPWYGVCDKENDLIADAKNKKEIIKLESGKSWTSFMTIKINI